MDDTRIGAIDIAKGIGIILVIIGHALPSSSMVRVFVYTFHMPLFFILAGMVMKSFKCNKSVFKAFLAEEKLIRAYCFYSVLFIIFDIVVRFLIQREIGLGELFWDFYQTVVFYGINVLWFLATLVLAKVLVKRICLISANKLCWLAIGLVLFATISMVSNQIQWMNMGKYRWIFFPLVAVLRALSSMVYVLLGYLAGEKVKHYIKKYNKLTIAYITLCTLIFLLYTFRFAGDVDVHLVRMGNWPIAFVCALFGFVAVLGVGVLLDSIPGIRNFFRFIGINSLFIMATHDYLKVMDIINRILKRLNLLEHQYSVLLRVVLLIVVECMLCKLCVPYVDKIILLNHNAKKGK